jgi:hypothetical protein
MQNGQQPRFRLSYTCLITGFVGCIASFGQSPRSLLNYGRNQLLCIAPQAPRSDYVSIKEQRNVLTTLDLSEV